MKQFFTGILIAGMAWFFWNARQDDERLRRQRDLPAELSHWRKEVESAKYNRLECKDDWWRASVAGDSKTGEAEENFIGVTKELIDLLGHKPGGALLTDDEKALLENCEASLVKVKRMDKEDEKEERKSLDAEQAAAERENEPAPTPAPTPKGSWMWEGRGDPLEKHAYDGN